MNREYSAIVALFLIGAVNALSCCFVVQEQAHEVYWTQYVTEVYTAFYNYTSITTLLTPYPTTTITNLITNVYPTSRVLTTTLSVDENPVALYTNPAYKVPEKTEVLAGTLPTVTGGVTVASPTGFWVYSTARVITASPVTDQNGNVACATLLRFSDIAPAASACAPTFPAVNANAAAYFAQNISQGVEISLTTPFIHIPTRTGLQISPTEVCAQGNGTENYGYPVQQLIGHLAENPFYSDQFPGIENCIPAGPSIKAVKALAISISSGLTTSGENPPDFIIAPSTTSDGGSTETPGGDLTTGTTSTVTSISTTTESSTRTIDSSTSSSIPPLPGSTTTISVTSTTSSIPALPESISDTSTSIPAGATETPIPSGELLPPPSSSSSLDISTSTVIVIPLPQISSSTSVSETTPGATSFSSNTSNSSITSSTSIESFPTVSSSETSFSFSTSSSSTFSSTSSDEPSSFSPETTSDTFIESSTSVGVLPTTTTISTVSLTSTSLISTVTSTFNLTNTTTGVSATSTPVLAISSRTILSWKLYGLLISFVLISI